MSYNPFEAPQVNDSAIGIVSGSREDLRSVARYQKVILVCILLYFIAVFAQFGFPVTIRPLLGLGILGVGLVGAIFAILLAIKTHGPVFGIILGILCLVPFLGLLTLLLINSKATTVLKKNL